MFYFLNIIANLTDEVWWLKYITPFGYTESASIIADRAIDGKYLTVGILLGLIGVVAAFLKYNKKDIA